MHCRRHTQQCTQGETTGGAYCTLGIAHLALHTYQCISHRVSLHRRTLLWNLLHFFFRAPVAAEICTGLSGSSSRSRVWSLIIPDIFPIFYTIGVVYDREYNGRIMAATASLSQRQTFTNSIIFVHTILFFVHIILFFCVHTIIF